MPEFERRQIRTQNSHLVRGAKPDRITPQQAQAKNPLPCGQQALGNQAMQRFAQSCPLRLPSPDLCPFGGACHACPVAVQTKLKIGKPNDRYEQEADRVADLVMRMPERRAAQRACPECEEEETLQAKLLTDQITPLVQRQLEPEEPEDEEEPLQAKLTHGAIQRQEEEPQEEQPFQAKRAGEQTPRISHGSQAQIYSLQGRGQPLPQPMRDFFEPRFGYDFSRVRIHTDATAGKTARCLSARAYTVGRHIVFAPGQSNFLSTAGQRLLAHELTHTMQQGALGRNSESHIMRTPECTTRALQRRCGAAQFPVIDEALREARRMATSTVGRLHHMGNVFLPGADPRLHPPDRLRAADLFRAHFKSSSPGDALMTWDAYRSIEAALGSLTRNSFRCVPQDCCPDEKEGRETYASVRGRSPPIYLCPAFFPGPSVPLKTTPGYEISTTGSELSPQKRGRALIHEVAHYKLGVGHSGGVFGLNNVNCVTGHGVRDFSQASQNAYVYDQFAYCIGPGGP